MPGVVAAGVNDPFPVLVTVEDGQTSPSDAAEKPRGYTLSGYILDDGFDGAVLQFNVSIDNDTFYSLKDNAGDVLSLTVTDTMAGNVDPAFFYCWKYIKPVVSAQTGATVITLVFV